MSSNQLGSFEGTIIYRRRPEAGSGMFLSVDLQAQLIVWLQKSKTQVCSKDKRIKNNCRATIYFQKWLNLGCCLSTPVHHRHCPETQFHEQDLCVFRILIWPVAKHTKAIWIEVAKSQPLLCCFVTRKAKPSTGFRFLPHQQCFSFCACHKRHCVSKREV